VSPDTLACSSSHFNGYSRPIEKQFQSEPDECDIVWPSVILFLDCIPWIKPPLIVAANTMGSWSQFATTTLDVPESHPLYGHKVMQQCSQKYTGDGSRPYYDRLGQNKRQLYFDGLPKAEGLVSDPSFGCPVPFCIFVGLNSTKTVPRSEWMYYAMNPQCADIGKEAPLPAATDLELYIQPPGNPYDEDEDEDDDDDVGFHVIDPQQFVSMLPSPPGSKTIDPPDTIEDIELEFLPIVISHLQPSPILPDSGECPIIFCLGSTLM